MSSNQTHNIIPNNDIVACSVTDYLNLVFKLPLEAEELRAFRGHGSIEFKPLPTVRRDLVRDSEKNIYYEMINDHPDQFRLDKTVFERLVRGQHYSYPTRLLDLSLNPLIALWFTCSEEALHHKDGRVIILDFNRKRVKFPQSDTVTLLCSMALMSDSEQDKLREAAQNIKNVPAYSRKRREMFRLSIPAKKLTKLAQSEKPYFENKINHLDLTKYYFVHAPKNNPRVISQSGCFMIAGLQRYLDITLSKEIKRIDIIIPSQHKAGILDQLKMLNIHESSLFPEMPVSGRAAKNKWSIAK